MQKENKLPEDKIIVKPIDSEKIIHLIKQILPNKKNQKYRIQNYAILKEPVAADENCLCNNECIYFLIDNKLHNGSVKLVYCVEVYINEKTKTGERYGMLPAFLFDIPLEEIKTMLLPECSLREYMQGRYNYNPRIIKNMKEFIQQIGG